jgi:predicted component of type VI protein secretion system
MYDFSLEPKLMNKMCLEVREKINKIGIIAAFGHIGDYNMHLQIACHKKEDYD